MRRSGCASSDQLRASSSLGSKLRFRDAALGSQSSHRRDDRARVARDAHGEAVPAPATESWTGEGDTSAVAIASLNVWTPRMARCRREPAPSTGASRARSSTTRETDASRPPTHQDASAAIVGRRRTNERSKARSARTRTWRAESRALRRRDGRRNADDKEMRAARAGYRPRARSQERSGSPRSPDGKRRTHICCGTTRETLARRRWRAQAHCS